MVQRQNPLFPWEMWSIFDNTEFALARTQNKVEAWHRRWEILIGRPHVVIFTMIKQIQKEQNGVEMEIIADRENRSTIDFLRGIAHNLLL